MNKKILALGVSAVLAMGTLAGCDSVETMEEAQNTKINVTVENAAIRDVETKATYTGTLVTNMSAAVTSKVSAKVLSVNAELGDWVEKGDVLVVLDSTDYNFQLRQAEAAKKQAEAAYESAKTSYNNVGGANEQTKLQLENAMNSATIAYNTAKTNYERQKALYDMGAISLAAFESAESGFENARLAYEGAKKNYEIGINVLTPGNEKSAEKGVESAKAAVETATVATDVARANVANTRITAPISGYISSKNVGIGQFAAAGMALFTIADSRELEAEINVTESVIPFVEVGGKAIVEVGSSDLEPMEGTVTVVNPVKSQTTGMYTVRVSVPNEEENLKVGMFADITLYTNQSVEDAVCVPSDAVMQEGEEYYVYVVNNSVAEKRIVKCGVTDGEYTSITEGIKEGEVIVCEGKEYISEKNNTVNIVE